jgi:glycosyltransferase involved in cell wall biosynthesis
MDRILALSPLHIRQRAISHIFLSLCPPHFKTPIQIWGIAPSIATDVQQSNLIQALPRSRYLKWLIYRLRMNHYINERRFSQELKQFDAAYIWPGVTPYAVRQAHRQQKPIFLERINCFTGIAKSILDTAYGKLKVPPTHRITPELIRQELTEIRLSDFIFCPSPWVKASFLEAGVPEEKLLLTSYGWSPERFPDLSNDRPNSQFQDRPFTIVFVGTICVRKGAHLLLQAYARSGIKGRLVLCGEIEPVIQELFKDLLHRSDVIHQPFTDNITAFYNSADLFAFPTLEEGSPLVSYEAMAHGLPMLVSPMGAGDIVRHQVEGYVLPPYEVDAWADAIQELACNPNLRAKFGRAARARAMNFTFDQVANRRAELMRQNLRATAYATVL